MTTDNTELSRIESAAISAPRWASRVATASLQLARQRMDPTGRTLPSAESMVPFVRRHSGALLKSLGVEVVTRGLAPHDNDGQQLGTDDPTRDPTRGPTKLGEHPARDLLENQTENPPELPMLIVSNHVSWIDPYVINSVFGARFVAKHDVASWFVVGPIARRFGAFFHKRGCFRDAWRTVDAAQRALRDGYPVGVFPEGTTTYGDRLLPFFPALFQAAIDSQTLVQPIALRYQTPHGEPTDAAAYAGQMTLVESVRNLLRVPRIVAEVQIGTQLEPGDHRRVLASRAEEIIDGLLWPQRNDDRERPRANWADLPENAPLAG